MTITGLVLTLSENEHDRRAALASLRTIPGIQLGELNGHWLPVVTSASSDSESWQFHDQFARIPGVIYADVVAINLDDADTCGNSPAHFLRAPEIFA